MKFSYKLQELRKGSGMSQEEFAELLGVSRQSVSKWESGKGYPEIDKLIFISNYFNTSLDLLLKDTPDYDGSVSMSGSIKSSTSKSRKKTKSSVKLTKPKDGNNQDSNPIYESDPMPNKKKESYPLRTMSASQSSQLRPVKKHRFGSSNKKLSRRGVISLSFLGGLIVSIMLISLSVGISNNNNDDDINSTVTEVYDEGVEVYDETVIYYDLYSEDWKVFYDDEESLSSIEQSLLDSIKNQSESLLIDVNDNVYVTGYDVICAYQEAQYQMKDSLNCMTLYEKYTSFEHFKNNYFIELYSYDLDEWVIINERMINIYPYQYYGDFTAPIQMDYSDFDILSSSAEDYMDWNNSPFEDVFMINQQSYGMVSSDILDLCVSAVYDRKSLLSMNRYMAMYKTYNQKYELVSYNGTITFVPKEFIMINVYDLKENEVYEVTEISENQDSVEIIEDEYNQDVDVEEEENIVEDIIEE